MYDPVTKILQLLPYSTQSLQNILRRLLYIKLPQQWKWPLLRPNLQYYRPLHLRTQTDPKHTRRRCLGFPIDTIKIDWQPGFSALAAGMTEDEHVWFYFPYFVLQRECRALE